MSIEEIKDGENLPSTLLDMTSLLLTDASKKFAQYQHTEKTLIFNLINSGLDSLSKIWWDALFNQISVPRNIDKVWTSFNYDQNHWNFERIR